MGRTSNQARHIASFLLAPQQEQLFLLGRGAACTQAAVRLAGAVAESDLESALARLLASHEILRTTFPRTAGMRVPQQAVHEQLPAEWTTPAAGADRLETGLDALLEREAAEIDVTNGPVLRAGVAEFREPERLLVLTASAACVDAPSMVVLLRELGSLVHGADGLEEPLQYADYAAWRRQLLADGGPDVVAAAAWWEDQQLPHTPRLLFSSVGEGAVAPTRLTLTVGDETVVATRAAAEALRVPTGIFLEACLHALVARLSGETELALAGLVDGRSQPELTEAIGPYAQYVPIRSRLDSATTFAELVDQIRRSRSEAVRRQDHASALQLQQAAEAGIAYSSLDIALDSELYPDGALHRLSSRGATRALELAVHARGGDFGCELLYDPTAYTSSDAERIAAACSALIAGAAADPTAPVVSLALLDAAERTRLIAIGAGDDRETPTAAVHQSFEGLASGAAGRLAVTDGAESLSYGELNAAANRLAHRLRALGVGRDRVAAVCLDRTPAALVALLGILKAGGAFMPLNFEHPPARLAHQLEEAEALALVTRESLLDRLPPFSGPVLCVDRDAPELAAEPDRDPEHRSLPGDIAYVIYTSGSTGLPKGVAVTHGNLANYTARMVECLGVTEPGLQFAVVSALSADLGYTSIFPALVTGGSVHLIPPDIAMDADGFSRYQAESPIDVLKITPSLLTALLSANAGPLLPRRWLICGGEPLTFELLGHIRAQGADCRILNHYGPTETTIGTCTCEVPLDARWPSTTVPIGRPLANTRAYVVDEAREPAPVGVAGELWIGGAGVARGYVNRPDETIERFIDDPFSDVPGARIYKSGDRARFLPDGTIEFLGRVDQQVKVRGFRVEPGEVEAAVLRHPDVRQAAVVPVGSDDVRLVAYVVASPQPSAHELRSFLADWLPEYMIPTVVPIATLPLTASGKVDRNALPDPDAAGLGPDHEYVAPRNDVEQEITQIWQELLGRERVGVNDDFFALGGHSLLATQMITRIRRRHGDVPLRALFAAPTVAELAKAVTDGAHGREKAG